MENCIIDTQSVMFHTASELSVSIFKQIRYQCRCWKAQFHNLQEA